MTSGKLVLCATPLGNLEDITLRALRALREADLIIAEDTRVTRTLLARHEIRTPVRSFHAGNAKARIREVSDLLREGRAIAVVSDAGMPGISDPGVELIREARAMGAGVEVLPGPSAVPAAAVLSGFDISSFRFDGFVPRKAGERARYLEGLRAQTSPVIWFEAPTRIVELLKAVRNVLPERRLFVLREYTKKFEEQLTGTAEELLARFSASPPRGEFTLVLEGARDAQPAAAGDVAAAIAFLRDAGLSARDAAEAVRLASGAPRNELYRMALERKRTS
jgi:16S rRNA (cytidine1402-2'-O)-methyltransferase